MQGNAPHFHGFGAVLGIFPYLSNDIHVVEIGIKPKSKSKVYSPNHYAILVPKQHDLVELGNQPESVLWVT